MLNLLITGSSGYLGSSFINEHSKDYTITTFSLQTKSLSDINFCDVDVVLHCAALVHQGRNRSSNDYRRVNVEYPLELARLAKAGGVTQFVFVSSVSVYGDRAYIDDFSVCAPETEYAKSKFEAETGLLSLCSDEFKVAIVRFPMVYGLNAPGNIATLVKFISHSPLVPLGAIKNRRSFISIENAIYALEKIINQNTNGIFLLADDDSISTSRVATIISRNISKRRIVFESKILAMAIRIFMPSLYKKLWGDLVINSAQSKRALSLALPVEVSDGLSRVIAR